VAPLHGMDHCGVLTRNCTCVPGLMNERQWEREELTVGVVVLLIVSDEDCVSERAAETKSFVSVLDGSHVNDHETDVHLDMLLLSVVVPVTLGDAVEALESVAVEYTVGVLEPLAV